MTKTAEKLYRLIPFGTAYTYIAHKKPGSHIPPSYLRRSRRLQLKLKLFGDLLQWVDVINRNLREMQIALGATLNH